MAYLTDETVADLAGGVASRDRWIQKQKSKAKAREHEARALGAVAFGAFAGAYADAAWSDDGVEYKLFNLAPATLVAAGVLHGLGWAGYGGKWTPELHNVGTGFFSVWVAGWGREMGRKGRTKPARHGTAGQYGAGALPQPGQRYAVDMNGVAAYG
jgi:hypothetical protein